ncbi:MAG: formylglycine-generating enzyme family protein [Nitrospinales bacterium]
MNIQRDIARFVPLILPFFLFSSHPVGAAENPEMALIPQGKFMTGKPGALKPMSLDAFYIDRHEVTQAEYEAVTGKNPSYFKGPRRPVEKTTWFDAKKYCEKIGKRLPTEWEWEKAAKAGTVTHYYWGDQMDGRFAWYKDNAGQQTHPVEKKQPNAFGLYDMSGNVWEWTSSDHEAGGKVQRGGSWRNGATSQQSAHRILSLPIFSYHYVGFRCALSPAHKP